MSLLSTIHLPLTDNDIRRFRERLLIWYRQNQRTLPWRATADPYLIWVSEIMLQQTQVATVLPYYDRFCSRFPTVAHLAEASQEEVLKLWEGLGYYARARNMHRAAQMIVDRFSGRVPDDPKAIRQLPGVGDYIAAAVLSIAFGKVFPVIDGNVKRVLARTHLLEAPVNTPASYKQFRVLADRLICTKSPGDFNQAMMELGALVCKPRVPLCSCCPIGDFCLAYRDGKTAAYPKRQQSKAIPERNLVAGIVLRNGRMLITRRASEGLLGGLWEFPGGEIGLGESADEACLRRIEETTGLTVGMPKHLTQVRHTYTHFKAVMDVYVCRNRKGRVRLRGPIDYRWIRFNEIERLPFPGIHHKIFPELREALIPDP